MATSLKLIIVCVCLPQSNPMKRSQMRDSPLLSSRLALAADLSLMRFTSCLYFSCCSSYLCTILSSSAYCCTMWRLQRWERKWEWARLLERVASEGGRVELREGVVVGMLTKSGESWISSQKCGLWEVRVGRRRGSLCLSGRRECGQEREKLRRRSRGERTLGCMFYQCTLQSMQQQQHPHSLRPQEQLYEQQIRTAYAHFPHYFATHSSDTLHLQPVPRTHNATHYTALVTTTDYAKYDCILELRGSVIRYETLKRVVQEGKVEVSKLPLLLYLNLEKGYLLSPKNIGKYLFQHPLLPLLRDKEGPQGNCYIQNHYGTKLLCVASRDIASGEQLLLEHRSYSNLLYTFSDREL